MNTNRREFLKSAGGIAVAFSWSVPTVLAQQAARPALPGSLGTNRMLNGWIRINPGGTVTVFTGKCVPGETIAARSYATSMASADTARTPNEGQTAGSLSVENSGTALRFACAEARAILLDLAAAKLGVAV